jgi:hypothetical protein
VTLAVIGLTSAAAGSSAANATVERPANNATAAVEIAVFCKVFMNYSLLFVLKKGLNAYCMG